MAAQASYGFLHQAIIGFEALARPPASLSSAFNLTPTLRSAQRGWAARSRALKDVSPSASTSFLLHSTSSSASGGVHMTASSPSSSSSSPSRSLATSTNSDDVYFRQSLRQTYLRPKQTNFHSYLPRRIARSYAYAHRPLTRHLEFLRPSPHTSSLLKGNSSLSYSYASPFHTSANAKNPEGKEHSHESSSGTQSDSTKKAAGLMDRLKELTRKYGWATVAVYFLLSAVDFGLCFFVINLIGAEHVRHAQDYILDMLVYGSHRDAEEQVTIGSGEADKDVPQKGNGILGFLKGWREKHKIEDVENKGGSGTSSIWATAVLAYTIHKTLLLPVRIGATAAATPAIVKYLQRFGINIARNPLPESVKQRGAQSIKSSRERLDKVREKNKDWL